MKADFCSGAVFLSGGLILVYSDFVSPEHGTVDLVFSFVFIASGVSLVRVLKNHHLNLYFCLCFRLNILFTFMLLGIIQSYTFSRHVFSLGFEPMTAPASMHKLCYRDIHQESKIVQRSNCFQTICPS